MKRGNLVMATIERRLDQGARLVDVDSTDEHLVLHLVANGEERRVHLDEHATRRLIDSDLLDRLTDSFDRDGGPRQQPAVPV